MSCKTRCPRNNCPGLIINVSAEGVSGNRGFCKKQNGTPAIPDCKECRNEYPELRVLRSSNHPDAGKTTRSRDLCGSGCTKTWVTVYASVGANLNGDGPGAMRKISGADLGELYHIFKESGGLKFYETIEHFSKIKALELGFVGENGEADMEKYTQHLLQEV